MVRKKLENMRVILIDPYWYTLLCPNIGLTYILSAVEQRYAVKLLDMSFYFKNRKDIITREIREYKPKVVGISVNSFSFRSGLEIAGWIRDFCPDINIIFGGVQPTLLPEDTIQNSLVDAICVGEGEDTFLEYLDRLDSGRLPDVKGIWYKIGNKIMRNEPRPFNENLDRLPFPNWDHWEIEKYLKSNLTIPGGLLHLSSRGCPYSCAYCSSPALRNSSPGRYCRIRDPEKVIDEIKINKEKYWKKGFRNIFFLDETFGVNEQQVKEFCELYLKEGLNKDFSWACSTRPDIVTKEWVEAVSEAGCAWVILGIESGDDYLRNQVYKRNISHQQIIEAVQHLRDNNIDYRFYFIIGSPEETRDSIAKSVKLIKETRPHGFSFYVYQPLPKTELVERYPFLREKTKVISLERSGMDMLNLRRKDISKIIFQLHWKYLLLHFVRGFKMRGIIFILDILKFIFSVGDCRVIPLTHPYLLVFLAATTINRYTLEDRRRYKVELLSIKT